MKLIFKVLFLMACLTGAGQASAQLAGWQATVVARDMSAGWHTRTVSGASFSDCNSERLNAVTDFESLGYTIENYGSCAPRFKYSFKIPYIYILEEPELIWPFPGPVCLTCPLFTPVNIKVSYPDHAAKVSDLVSKYRIQDYNKALLELQAKFKLGEFEKEIFAIEQQMKR